MKENIVLEPDEKILMRVMYNDQKAAYDNPKKVAGFYISFSLIFIGIMSIFMFNFILNIFGDGFLVITDIVMLYSLMFASITVIVFSIFFIISGLNTIKVIENDTPVILLTNKRIFFDYDFTRRKNYSGTNLFDADKIEYKIINQYRSIMIVHKGEKTVKLPIPDKSYEKELIEKLKETFGEKFMAIKKEDN